MRRWLAFNVLMLVALVAWGQSVTGRVTDANGQPLVGASVMLQGEGGKTLTFGKTDKEGRFSLKTPEGKQAQAVMFNMLGYERQTVQVAKLAETVVLKEKVTEIKEVTVQSEKIQERGDTLIYSVAGFREKQDRTIADVIGRMPGMQVQESGQITFNGQPINRFYVEGMDLVGSKYTQVSEALNADNVKSVEVYRRHQPVKALRKIEFSEQAALNIVLKDEAKNVWNGAVEAETGLTLQGSTDWLRSLKLTEMLFAKKRQSVSMYRHDNTGQDVSREIGDHFLEGKWRNGGGGMVGGFMPSGGRMLDGKRYSGLFNNSHLLATNWLFKTKSDDDLRLQLSALLDKSEQEHFSETSYTTLADTANTTMTQRNLQTGYRSEYRGELLYKRNEEKYYFGNTLTGYIDFNRSEATTQLNGRETRQNTKARKRYATDNFKLVRQLADRQSVTVNADLNYTYLPSEMQLLTGGRQQLNNTQLNGSAEARYGHELGAFRVDYVGGATLSSDKMEISNRDTLMSDRYVDGRLFIQPTLSVGSVLDKFYVQANVRLEMAHVELSGNKASELLAIPSINLTYQLTKKTRWSGNYNYRQQLSGSLANSSTIVNLNYNNVSAGTGQLQHSHGHGLSTNLSYTDALRRISGSISGSYAQEVQPQLFREELLGDIHSQTATEVENTSNSYTLRGTVSKSFRWARLSISLSGNYSWLDYEVLVGDNKVPTSSQSGGLSARVSMSPLKNVSLEYQPALSYHHQDHHAGMTSRALASAVDATHRMKLYWMPGNWRLTWVGEYYRMKDSQLKSNFFSDVSLAYRTKTYEAGFYLYNIFGQERQERRYISQTSQQYTWIRLRPREFLVKAAFNF